MKMAKTTDNSLAIKDSNTCIPNHIDNQGFVTASQMKIVKLCQNAKCISTCTWFTIIFNKKQK